MPLEEKFQPVFSIGDKVFKAYVRYEEVYKQCPDCLGSLVWSVAAPSGETFEVPCNTCIKGIRLLAGQIGHYEYTPFVEVLTIGSIRIDTSDSKNPIAYMCKENGVGSGTIHYEGTLFRFYDEAMSYYCYHTI